MNQEIPKDWYLRVDELRFADDIPKSLNVTRIFFGCYVYFLIRRGKVQYVGQTINLGARVSSHRAKIPFDEVRAVSVRSEGLLNATEKRYIKRFNPPFNSVHSTKRA